MLCFADRFDQNEGTIPINVPNFWIKQNGNIYRNLLLPRKENLDDLPYAARDLYYDQFPIFHHYGVKHFIVNRGCPYKCTYCFNKKFNHMYREETDNSKIYYSRSPQNICDEINWLSERVPIEMVSFVDDSFALDRKWIMKFCAVYSEKVSIPFSINARFDNVDAEMVEALSTAGLRLVFAGVESGDDELRNNVLKRKMSKTAIYEGAALFKKNKVKIVTENILGIPGETYNKALKTLQVNKHIDPDVANVSIFSPFPKLPLTEYSVEHGFFDGNFDLINNNYYHGSVLRFESKRELQSILNLRCFFNLLTHHFYLFPVIRLFLYFPPNRVFRWAGDLIDGFYLKKCLPFHFKAKTFKHCLFHFLKNYRS